VLVACLGIEASETVLDAATAKEITAVLQDMINVESFELQEQVVGERLVLFLLLLDQSVFGNGLLFCLLLLWFTGRIFRVWIVEWRVFDNLAKGLGGGAPRLPFLVAQVRDYAGEEVEELIGVLLLPVGKLVDGSVPD
jgi:hypothetical protein